MKSILFFGIPGKEGAAALAEIMTGMVNPSGKLAFTIARRYEDYPAVAGFCRLNERLAEIKDKTYGTGMHEWKTDADISYIMTSFNKINGVFAGGNLDLCTHILREEWGYRGAVVTDWGDMDVVVDGADAVAAGNDIVMPGGPPVIGQILRGYQEGRVSREAMEKAEGHLLYISRKLSEFA